MPGPAEPYRVLLSRRVATELERVFRRVAKDSPQNAAALVKKILDAMDGLKTFPHRTVVQGQRPGVRRPVRSLPVRPYVIFFRVIDESRAVRILQGRHGARRRPKRFG